MRDPTEPAAAERTTPAPVKPPAAARGPALSPEQIDALLEEYLREPLKPRKVLPPRQAQARGTRPALRLFGRRAPRPIVAAMVVPVLLAAGGAYAYLTHLAQEPSPTAAVVSQESAPPPAPPAAGARVPIPSATAAPPSSQLPPPRKAASVARQITTRATPIAREGAITRRGSDVARPQPADPEVETAAAMAAAPPPAPTPSVEVQLPRLTPSEVAAVLASHREAFDACVADWADRQPQIDVTGLKVDLFITVDPTGGVTQPLLGNPDLERSALGECLKAAGTKMIFPRFGGEALEVRVPLVLGRGAQ